MAEEKETKSKDKGWQVGLQLVDENQPPMKVFQKEGEEPIDEYGILAYIANKLDKLQGLL